MDVEEKQTEEQNDWEEKVRRNSERWRRRNKQSLCVQPAAVLPAAHPAEAKAAGSCRKYSVLRPNGGGGACAHKTDGKLL